MRASKCTNKRTKPDWVHTSLELCKRKNKGKCVFRCTESSFVHQWVTVRDPEETDWVWRMTEFMGRMEEWEKRREARESRQEDRAQRMMVMIAMMANRMERLVALTKEVLAELREDGEGELEDGNGGGKADGDDDAEGEDEDMEN